MDIHDMYSGYGFPVQYLPQLIDKRTLEERAAHLQEELVELMAAIQDGNLADAADALVDLVVIAKGTAVMLGLPWAELWKEVHRAISSKVVGVNPKRPDHPHDLIKPDGWIPPRIQEVLDGNL